MTPDTTFERGLPASVDAERSILGGNPARQRLLLPVRSTSAAEASSLTRTCRILRRRLEEMINSNRAVDIETLAEELRNRKELESIGGVSYLASLIEGPAAPPVNRGVCRDCAR